MSNELQTQWTGLWRHPGHSGQNRGFSFIVREGRLMAFFFGPLLDTDDADDWFMIDGGAYVPGQTVYDAELWRVTDGKFADPSAIAARTLLRGVQLKLDGGAITYIDPANGIQWQLERLHGEL